MIIYYIERRITTMEVRCDEYCVYYVLGHHKIVVNWYPNSLKAQEARDIMNALSTFKDYRVGQLIRTNF